MKLCNYCETTLPEDANICTQCHMILGDERTMGDVAIATETEDATIKGWSVPVEAQEEHKNGVAVIPNPETPIPDIAMMEDLPTLASDTLESPGSSPTLQDKNVSDEPTMLIEQDADVITDDPTPPLSIVNDAETITGDLNPTLAAELEAETITDDPTPILQDARDADVGAAGDEATPALLMELDAETITDDPTPVPLMEHTVETITDDPAPAALMEQEAVEITDDPRPVLEHQSDTAIIRADAPIPETDPNLSIATIDALATLTDHDDDPTPGKEYLPEYTEGSDALAVMELPGTGAESSSHNGHAIPAPLYPDYGKAASTTPAPLYEDYKKASNTASMPTSPPLVPGKTSAGSMQLWSWRGFIAIALCLLIILSSIGLFISKKAQTGGGPNVHTTAKLDVITQFLTSKVVKGHKIILAAEIANKGTQALHWTADTSKTAWLSMDKNKLSGTIAAGAPQQLIYARADATALDVGNFSGAIQLHSNGGNSSIQVTLNVIAATDKAQPMMTVDQTSLDFGSLSQGQQATQTVNIGNAGTATLAWKANIGNLNWITLTPTAGTILAGGYPQLLTITIQTTNLKTGFTPASINFTSNASAPQPPLSITVNVMATNGNALTISASPGSFTNGCLNCTILLSASQSSTGAPTSVHWSTSEAGVPGITFSPSAGTLLAGQSTPVTVTVPNTTCPASANFTFAGAANTFSVLWSCTPPPTPNAVLTVSPSSLANCYTCTVYISPAAGSQGSLKWTSSGSGISGTSISPASGTVAAGNSQAVTITVPNTNCPANANSATFTFNGQGLGNSASVAWSCTAPTPQTPLLSVNPNTLNSSQCAKNSDGTYNCTVTLSENPAGNLSWSTSTSVGGTFSQAAGNFSSTQTSVTITVNNILCQTGSFSFNGPNNSAPVQWNCNPPQTPVISVNPTSLNSNSSACSSDGNGGYTCTVTLSENPQGTISWQENNNLGVSVSQQSGTLTPGNSSAQVNLFSIPCSSQGTNGTFTFLATGSNSFPVNWSCTGTAPPTVTTPPTIPAAPSNVSASATDSSTIQVTWSDNSNNEDGFTVSNNVTSVNVAANTTSYTWGGLSAGSYMCVHVLAYNTAGSSAWTSYACATTPTVPAAPSNVSATANSSSTIVVTWNDNSNNESGFNIYNGGTTVNVAANTTSYTWGGLAAGTYMCFSVNAYNGVGSSAWSAYGCTTTPTVPAAPSNVSATATSTSTIVVTWNDNSNNESGFIIYNGGSTVDVAANTTSYTWGGLAASTYMCFSVKAYNGVGSSAWSAYGCTTTPAIPAAPSNFHQATARMRQFAHIPLVTDEFAYRR